MNKETYHVWDTTYKAKQIFFQFSHRISHYHRITPYLTGKHENHTYVVFKMYPCIWIHGYILNRT